MITDVKIIDLTCHEDDRGYLIEIVRHAEDSMPHGVVHKFGQVYLVGDPVRGTIRAFHKHEELWDWFFISHGTAKFVLVDDREGPTKDEKMTIIASSRRPRLVVVPPGVYHGWMSLEDDTQMISVASHCYNPEQPDEVRIPPNFYGGLWTVKGK